MTKKRFKDFEIKVLKILIGDKLVSNDLNKIIEFVSYEYTGVGYFLTVRHPM